MKEPEFMKTDREARAKTLKAFRQQKKDKQPMKYYDLPKEPEFMKTDREARAKTLKAFMQQKKI